MVRRPLRPRILVIGSSNTDLVARLDRLPKPGETRFATSFSTLAGGKGANQAVASARAGGRVRFVARLGTDAYGDQALAGLRKEGISVDQISRDPRRPSGVAMILVGDQGENCIAIAPGANAGLSRTDIRRAAGAFREADVVLAQLEVPLPVIETAAGMATRHGIPFLLNPAPAQLLPETLLPRISCLTPNETEAAELVGFRVRTVAEADRAARRLRDQGVAHVVITLGARGAFLSGPDIHQLQPGFPAEAVDTVGAGDVFNGALAVAWSEGLPFPEAVRFAQAAASISVTRPGAQDSAPFRSEIERLLAAGPVSAR